MIDIRRILCPIDFSDCSRRAIDHAFAIARRHGATVTVLHVFSPSPVLVGAGSIALEPVVLRPGEREQLLSAVRGFAAAEGAPGVTMDAVVAEGHTATEILSCAAGIGADLMVVGTHGRSGFERLALGSVAEKVIRTARCPVLTVSQHVPDAVPATAALYTRVLCPVDFSPSSLRALERAAAMAHEAAAPLTVLHVVAHELEIDGADAVFSADAGMTVAQFVTEREKEIRRRLQEAIAGIGPSGRVDILLTHGKPWREVVRMATERQSDLIVMGVEGHRFTDVLRFGSTAQHVVRAAPCPVMTLRHA